jgi:hypothetical protein
MTFTDDIEPKLFLYRFYFLYIDQPIVVEASNEIAARICLKQSITSLGIEYQNSKVIGQTVERPVAGVSVKYVNDQRFVWDGKKWELK